MKILLTGASGFIGQNLLAILTQHGHEVIPLSRRHGVDLANMCLPDDWQPWIKDIDAVINAVGIIGETATQRFDTLHTAAPKALFEACHRAGVRRIVQISALGADMNAFSRYHLSKKAADDYLRGLDLDWFILRPSLIYGRGGSSAELFMGLARLPAIPVIGNGRQPLQPVHIADLASTVLRCLTAPRAQKTLDIVGNECIDYRDWLQRLRQAQGYGPAPVLAVPVCFALLGVTLAQSLNPLLRRENIQMLLHSHQIDGGPWYEFIGRPAMKFTPRLLGTDAAGALADIERTS